jgi:hypothetical protein
MSGVTLLGYGFVMSVCKECLSENIVKNGLVCGKQRYKCAECAYNFVEGDQRANEGVIVKKAMCTRFYSLSKASYTMLVKIFHTWPSWYIVGLSKPEPNYRHRNLREVPRDAGLMKCGILLVQKKKYALGPQSC